jgi:hypothetical protein
VPNDVETNVWGDEPTDSQNPDVEDELPEVEEVISVATVRQGPYNYRMLRRRMAQELLGY